MSVYNLNINNYHWSVIVAPKSEDMFDDCEGYTDASALSIYLFTEDVPDDILSRVIRREIANAYMVSYEHTCMFENDEICRFIAAYLPYIMFDSFRIEQAITGSCPALQSEMTLTFDTPTPLISAEC